MRAQAVLVDRLVATVGEQALTWRDVEAARLLGSIPATGSPAEAVDRLVTRELMHREVERLAVAPPIAAAIDQRFTAAAQPTDVEVAREAGAPGRTPTAEDLLDARRRLVQARRAALVSDWLAGIRARTNVQIALPR